MAKIDIISGFLGAGKTTLIQKLLKEALKGEKVVLIENEFGEIGIDGGFLKDAGIEVTEMNSGCICCSLVGDFGSALKEVVTQYNPDRIIIEPSGVGKLSDVIKAVQGVAEDVELDLNSFVTVADAKKCKMYIKNFGEFYNNQVEYAGSIILSRTGDVAEDKLNESVALLREHNEKAAIITTPWDELSGEQILKVMEDGNDMVKELLEEEEICPVCGGHHDHEHHHDHDHEHHHHHDHDEECSCGCGHDHDHHHHHHADEVFTSWGKETPKKYNKEELDTILQTLSKDDSYGMILRSKGILQTEDGSWIQFDLVPGEYEIREGSADYTGRICVIGSKLKEDESDSERQYKEGYCKTSLEVFLNNFEIQKLTKPVINKGWFKNIDDSLYPEKISFAFFDGDFYSSIIDSFEKVYPKLSSGARVIIHDYGWEALPGCKKACDDFLEDKPEKIEMLQIGIGLMIKK